MLSGTARVYWLAVEDVVRQESSFFAHKNYYGSPCIGNAQPWQAAWRSQYVMPVLLLLTSCLPAAICAVKARSCDTHPVPPHPDLFSQVLQLLEEGESNRHVGSTKMNDTSSRSHTVFRMVRYRAPIIGHTAASYDLCNVTQLMKDCCSISVLSFRICCKSLSNSSPYEGLGLG